MTKRIHPIQLWQTLTDQLPTSGKYAFASERGWVLDYTIPEINTLRVGITDTTSHGKSVCTFPHGTWEDHLAVARKANLGMFVKAISAKLGSIDGGLNEQELLQVEQVFNLNILKSQVTLYPTGFHVQVPMDADLTLHIARTRTSTVTLWAVSVETGEDQRVIYVCHEDLAVVYAVCRERVEQIAKRADTLKDYFDV